MNKKQLAIASFLLLSILAYTSGCKKDSTNEPLEPIAFVQPDSSIEHVFAGDSQALEIKFTTDRPINWVKGMYDIDSLNQTGYMPTYPDTLFFIKLDTLDPRVNLYTYTGSYYVPDSLNPYDVIRFKISFQAGKTTFTTGQNYPAGITSATKEFSIVVR